MTAPDRVMSVGKSTEYGGSLAERMPRAVSSAASTSRAHLSMSDGPGGHIRGAGSTTPNRPSGNRRNRLGDGRPRRLDARLVANPDLSCKFTRRFHHVHRADANGSWHLCGDWLRQTRSNLSGDRIGTDPDAAELYRASLEQFEQLMRVAAEAGTGVAPSPALLRSVRRVVPLQPLEGVTTISTTV